MDFSIREEDQSLVDLARERVAALIGADPEEIVFISGATESNNLALRGFPAEGDHLLVSAIEHSSVLDTARALTRQVLAFSCSAPTSTTTSVGIASRWL